MKWVKWALVFGAVVAVWAAAYSAGYDSARAELLDANEAREAEVAAAYGQAVTEAEGARDTALAELDELRRRPPVVITDVQTKIIELNVCRDFDDEFIGLLDGT